MSGQDQPAGFTRAGSDPIFLLKSSSLAAVWRTDCWDLGWDQEAGRRGEVRGEPFQVGLFQVGPMDGLGIGRLLVRSGQEKAGWAFARFCLGQESGQESGSL